jgi:ribosomal protein S14
LKYLIIKNKKRRNNNSVMEVNHFIYSSLLSNQSCVYKNLIYVKNLLNLNIYSKCKNEHNRCLMTGRSRAIFKFCKLSRIMLRKQASAGFLVGLRKASW